MNVFKKNTPLILLGLMLLLPQRSTPLSLNVILAESAELKLGDLSAAVLDDYVVFERDINGARSVWSYHRDSQILTNLGIDNPTAITRFKDRAIIESGGMGAMKVHVSDGTVTGSELLRFSEELLTTITGQAVYLRIGDQTLLRFDGLNSSLYSTNNDIFTNRDGTIEVCELDESRFSFLIEVWVGPFQFPGTGLQLYGNYPIEPSLVPGFPRHEGGDVFLTEIQGHCLISNDNSDYGGAAQPRIYSGIHDSSGITTAFEAGNLMNDMSDVVIHQGQLYGVEIADGSHIITIHRLTAETLESTASTVHALPEGLLADRRFPAILRSTPDGLLLVYDQLLMFDADLNPLPINQAMINGFNTYINRESRIATVASDIVLVNQFKPSLGNEPTYLNLIAINNQAVSALFASTSQLRLDRFHPNPTDELISLNAFDYNSQKKGVYLVENTPSMGALINGAWYHPTLAGQGLSIRHGTRQNGSEYVFVTGYFFRNGTPIWLAGSAELGYHTATTEVALYEYGGPGLFEPEQPADATYFGDLTLELLGCDQLQAELNHDNLNDTLLLYRAENDRYQDRCQD
jgi:hypothetical protein